VASVYRSLIWGIFTALDLFSAISSLPREEYAALHVALAEGPLNKCFVWKEKIIKDGKTILRPVSEKKADNKSYYCYGVLKEYEACFSDISAGPTGKLCLAKDRSGSILPIWVAKLPLTVEVPEERTFAAAAEFMTLCRNQRQTDEKGLSCWSSGFGACGNPTKMQLRMQKKLSMIIGCLLKMDKASCLYISDDMTNELPLVHAQLLEWRKHNATLSDRLWYFVVPSSASKVMSSLKGHVATYIPSTSGNHLMYFPNFAPEFSKKSEWDKVEKQSELFLKNLLGDNFDEASRKGNQVHVYSQVLSKVSFSQFTVFTIGSAHNMMGLMTSDEAFSFASCQGEKIWDVELQRVTKVTSEEFIFRTMSHNASRSTFFLNGMYYFNAKLNMLRHIPGKTMDFVIGVLDDIQGIDVVYDETRDPDFVDGSQSGGEEHELEDDSSDEDDPGENAQEEVLDDPVTTTTTSSVTITVPVLPSPMNLPSVPVSVVGGVVEPKLSPPPVQEGSKKKRVRQEKPKAEAGTTVSIGALPAGEAF